MSDTLTTLGTILERPQPRDAVHVAVMSMTAGETLRPGQHVGVADEDILKHAYDDYHAGLHVKLLGIVDPFLKRPVLKGQVFWLWLYPNTITSLRHSWTHPEIPDA